VLLEASPGAAGGLMLTAGSRPAGPAAPGGPGSGAPGATDERAELLASAPAEARPDPETVRRARQIAARLSVPRPRRDTLARRGAGALASVRYRGGSDDIDLDATLVVLAEHPVPGGDDIIVRERVRTRRSVVLAVDVSGSMRGERVRTAAATVGALSDCVHNAGPDPRHAAAGLARLDVLLDASGEQDPELARDLARLGHGRLARVNGYRDVAPALSGLFAR
jgi:hypothetical protein